MDLYRSAILTLKLCASKANHNLDQNHAMKSVQRIVHSTILIMWLIKPATTIPRVLSKRVTTCVVTYAQRRTLSVYVAALPSLIGTRSTNAVFLQEIIAQMDIRKQSAAKE